MYRSLYPDYNSWKERSNQIEWINKKEPQEQADSIEQAPTMGTYRLVQSFRIWYQEFGFVRIFRNDGQWPGAMHLQRASCNGQIFEK